MLFCYFCILFWLILIFCIFCILLLWFYISHTNFSCWSLSWFKYFYMYLICIIALGYMAGGYLNFYFVSKCEINIFLFFGFFMLLRKLILRRLSNFVFLFGIWNCGIFLRFGRSTPRYVGQTQVCTKSSFQTLSENFSKKSDIQPCFHLD